MVGNQSSMKNSKLLISKTSVPFLKECNWKCSAQICRNVEIMSKHFFSCMLFGRLERQRRPSAIGMYRHQCNHDFSRKFPRSGPVFALHVKVSGLLHKIIFVYRIPTE